VSESPTEIVGISFMAGDLGADRLKHDIQTAPQSAVPADETTLGSDMPLKLGDYLQTLSCV
jgi:hypothetical protein